jgi:hypothetical protein
MPEFLTDLDLVQRSEAPDWLPPFERVTWRLSDRNARRRMLNEFRQRQQEDSFRHAESLRRAAAHQPVPVPVVPDQERCQEMVIANPAAYAAMSERARDAYNRVRRMEGAPLRQLDNRWEEFKRALTGQPPWRRLQVVCEAESYFIDQANSDDLSHRGWLESEAMRQAVQAASEERNARAGLAFSPGKFVGELARKGMLLLVMGDGGSLRGAGNLSALTQSDRDAIAAHKADLIDFLQRTEQLA